MYVESQWLGHSSSVAEDHKDNELDHDMRLIIADLPWDDGDGAGGQNSLSTCCSPLV